VDEVIVTIGVAGTRLSAAVEKAMTDPSAEIDGPVRDIAATPEPSR
jgi:hypothetical protein